MSRPDPRVELCETVAYLSLEGECLSHGRECKADLDDCDPFVWENDDANETLMTLIERARRAVGR